MVSCLDTFAYVHNVLFKVKRNLKKQLQHTFESNISNKIVLLFY